MRRPNTKRGGSDNLKAKSTTTARMGGCLGWILDRLERLQKAGARVAEDPDFLSGLAAVRRKAQFRATLSQDIREAETRGDWRQSAWMATSTC